MACKWSWQSFGSNIQRPGQDFGNRQRRAAKVWNQAPQSNHPKILSSRTQVSTVFVEQIAGPSLASKVGAAASCLCLVATMALSPPHGVAADLVLGEQVFKDSCAACHAGGGNNIPGEESRVLTKEALSKYTDGQFNEEGIIELGWHFLSGLSAEEIDAVASYVYRQADMDLWQ